MNKPVESNHPVLGRLQQWDDMVCCDVNYEGESVGITISHDGDAEPLIGIAVDVANRLPALVEAAKECAASKLLSLKNGTWLRDGESAVTAEEFQAKMALNSIGIDEDRSGEFSFNDGGLFWDHYITVAMNSDLEFTGAYVDG